MSTAVISTAIFTCPGRAGPLFRLDPLFGIIPVVTLFVVCAGAVVGVNAGAAEGFSHVNARPQTVGRTKKLFRNVTCLFRCCLMSVSMVALSSERMFNKHQVQTCTLRHC